MIPLRGKKQKKSQVDTDILQDDGIKFITEVIMSFPFKKQFSFLVSGYRTKMDIMFMLLVQINVILSADVSGTITENMTFFYRKLPVAPSIRANIEFSVFYSQRSMAYKYPSIGIYTNYPKIEHRQTLFLSRIWTTSQ